MSMKATKIKQKFRFDNIDKSMLITFGLLAGNVNNLTFPKSSPVASNVLSRLRLATFTSVPSAPSGQIPIVSNDRVQVCDAHSVSRNDELLVTCRQRFGFPKNI